MKSKLSLIALLVLSNHALAEETLEEIIVTSTNKLSQSIKNTTANVTIITAQDIQSRGYQSVSEILSHTSGFAAASNGGAGQTSAIYLRGFGASDILVLVDGIAMTDYTQPSPSAALEHISVDNIQRVEIVKGAQSGIWGANATAGVINIITKSNAHSSYAKIKLKAGSNSTKGIGIEISKSSEQTSLYLSANVMDTDGFSALSPKNAEDDGYRNAEFHLRASVNPSSNSRISYFMHNNKSNFDYDSGFADDNASTGESKQTLYGFDYKYQDDSLSVQAKASSNTIDRVYNGSYGPFITKGKSTNLSLTAGYDLSHNQNIVAGIEKTKNQGETTYSPKKEFKNSAIFASYTGTIDDFLGAKTTLNATLRYDDFDKFDNKSTYRFGIKRECVAIDGLHSSINIYSAYKAPSITQFSNALGTLKPESTEGYEVSIGYQRYITATYFRNTTKDKIIANYNPTDPYAPPTYSNSGDGATIDGIELEGEYAFGDSGFIISANITHLIKDEDDSGKKLLRVPTDSANLSLDYYFADESHIGLMAQYVGKRRDVYYDPITWTQSDVTLEGYTTLNLSYNTQIGDNLALSVHAKNILNKEYETVKGYSTGGRSFYATAEYKF